MLNPEEGKKSKLKMELKKITPKETDNKMETVRDQETEGGVICQSSMAAQEAT